jgi:hypothetical protein
MSPRQRQLIGPQALDINHRRMLQGSALECGVASAQQKTAARTATQIGLLQGKATLMTSNEVAQANANFI